MLKSKVVFDVWQWLETLFGLQRKREVSAVVFFELIGCLFSLIDLFVLSRRSDQRCSGLYLFCLLLCFLSFSCFFPYFFIISIRTCFEPIKNDAHSPILLHIRFYVYQLFPLGGGCLFSSFSLTLLCVVERLGQRKKSHLD